MNEIFMRRGAAVIEVYPVKLNHVVYERIAHYAGVFHFKVSTHRRDFQRFLRRLAFPKPVEHISCYSSFQVSWLGLVLGIQSCAPLPRLLGCFNGQEFDQSPHDIAYVPLVVSQRPRFGMCRYTPSTSSPVSTSDTPSTRNLVAKTLRACDFLTVRTVGLAFAMPR